jgi:hypothetical protein
MATKAPDVNNAFTQLEAALCLLARAKGESPAAQYFTEKTQHVRVLTLDGAEFQVVMTSADQGEEKPKSDP